MDDMQTQKHHEDGTHVKEAGKCHCPLNLSQSGAGQGGLSILQGSLLPLTLLPSTPQPLCSCWWALCLLPRDSRT